MYCVAALCRPTQTVEEFGDAATSVKRDAM